MKALNNSISVILISILLVSTFSCETRKQPNLDAKEIEYFKNLSKTYNCKVEREYSYEYLKDKNSKFNYILIFEFRDTSFKKTAEPLILNNSNNFARFVYSEILKKNCNLQNVDIVLIYNTGKDSDIREYNTISIDSLLVSPAPAPSIRIPLKSYENSRLGGQAVVYVSWS